MLQLATICGRWNILRLEEKSWKKFSSRNRQPTHTRSLAERQPHVNLSSLFFEHVPHGKKMLMKKNFLFPLSHFFLFSPFRLFLVVSKIRKKMCVRT